MGNISHVKNFLDYLKIEKRYSVHTTVSYKNDLNQFNLYLSNTYSGIEFHKVEMIHIRSYMVHLLESKLAKSTVSRKISSIKSLYKYLKKEQLISSSPVQLLETPKLESRLPVFLKEGIRLSELIGLKDVDVRNGELKVLGKRNKERIIPLSNNIQPLIDQYLTLRNTLDIKTSHFFVTDKGNKLYEKFVYRKVNRYLSMVSSKQKKSPHILRHTFATHMLNNGADLNAIKEILGHENLSATQVYTHNTFQKLKSIHKQSHPRG